MNIGNIGPHVLEDKRNRPLGWHDAMAELVDNAFDADATRVEIVFGPNKVLTVIDDGNGCGNIERMLTIADHMKSATTRLGRYGVGLKDAGCWLWGELSIETVYRGMTSFARVNWPALVKQGTWDLPDPQQSEPSADLQRGTRLRFRRYERQKPKLDELAAKLGYTFAPGIAQGKQVLIVGDRGKRFPCEPWTPPPMTEIVEDAFSVDGKMVSLKAGMIPADDTNPKAGFNFAYGHRNIINSSLGSGGKSVSRICGLITLGEGWRLSTNKNEICDDQEALGRAINERCYRLLETAEQQAESIYNRDLENSVTESIRNYLNEKKRAARDKGETEGSVDPKGTDRRVRKASKTRNRKGPIQDFGDVGSLGFEFRDYEDGCLGTVDLPGNRIILNGKHPRMATHRDSQNKEAIVDACLMLFAWAVFEKKERSKFPFARDHETMIDALGGLLNTQAEMTAAAHA